MNIETFTRAYPPATPEPGRPARFLPFVGGRDLLVAGDSLISGKVGDTLPFAAPGTPVEPLYLGDLDGAACLAYPASDIAAAESATPATGLRNLFDALPASDYGVAGLAAHLLHWQTASRFCSRCGNETAPTPDAWAKTCPVCSYCVYPVVSPAVLMLIHDGGSRVLLSHKSGWGDRWSILAGFVEPGETMEECVQRETMEEVGLRVSEIVYRGSQPWPYPHQLMVGFVARADPDAPLVVDESELDGAQWFDADALPQLPGILSLSRQLLDEWLAGVGGRQPKSLANT